MSGDAEQFQSDLWAVINRHRAENDLTYCQVVGTMQLVMSDLIDESRQDDDEESEAFRN